MQYVKTMGNIFTGQAYSYTQGLNVLDEIKRGFPATLSLAFGAGIIWLLSSIVIGTLAAVRAGRYTDRILTVLAMAGVSFPPFFLGAVLLYFLGYKANLFPLGGYVPLTQDPWQWLVHLCCRGSRSRCCSSASTHASCVRRSSTRSTRTTCAPRTPRVCRTARCWCRHILRNSLIPIISLWGLDMAQVIGGGAILTETVFNLHGVGQLAAQSISSLDIIPLLVIVIITASAVVVLAALVDIVYALPRPAHPARRERRPPPTLSRSQTSRSRSTPRTARCAPSTASRSRSAAAKSWRSSANPGSGKSVTAMTLMGLTRGPNATFEGEADFDGTELVRANDEQLRRIRGAGIAMVFQDPMSSLDPVYRVGDQIVEQIRAHDHKISKAQALDRAVALMERVGIPRAAERLRSYPHEFSGGMRQRVMIAMALSCSPKLLIADEPTTALDVTIQAQILDELRQLRDETGAGVILVTHDLGVVADIADRVIVMYAGRVVEQGTLDDIFYDPQHPYTWGLLGSITRIDSRPIAAPAGDPGMPPSLLRRPRAATSARAARTRSRSARRCPRSSTAPRPPESRTLLPCARAEARLRQVGDQIGLASPEAVIS